MEKKWYESTFPKRRNTMIKKYTENIQPLYNNQMVAILKLKKKFFNLSSYKF